MKKFTCKVLTLALFGLVFTSVGFSQTPKSVEMYNGLYTGMSFIEASSVGLGVFSDVRSTSLGKYGSFYYGYQLFTLDKGFFDIYEYSINSVVPSLSERYSLDNIRVIHFINDSGPCGDLFIVGNYLFAVRVFYKDWTLSNLRKLLSKSGHVVYGVPVDRSGSVVEVYKSLMLTMSLFNNLQDGTVCVDYVDNRVIAGLDYFFSEDYASLQELFNKYESK
jgi:hypothetical protein